jgi:hypothetical protein
MNTRLRPLLAIALALVGCRLGELVNSPPTGSRLQFSVQPAAATAGSSIQPPVRVTVYNELGQPDSTYDGTVELSLAANPSGAQLLGETSRPVVNGVATFGDVRVSQPGTGFMLRARAAARLDVASARFNVTDRPPAGLAFAEQPSTVGINTPIAPAVQVAALDDDGEIVTTYTGMISIELGSNPVGGELSGTRSVQASGGIATFADLSLNRAGSGYRLRASAPNIGSRTSNAFTVSGRATRLVFTTQPSTTREDRHMRDIRVAARDDDNKTVTTFNGPITIALAPGSPGGQLRGTLTVNARDGVATFEDLEITRPGFNYRLVASSPGLTAATSNAFRVTRDDDITLQFMVQPTIGRANTPITPAVQVHAVDSTGATVTTFDGDITLDMAPNALGGKLYGTLTTAAIGGVAVFPDLRIDIIGLDYRLVAAFAGESPLVQSASFAVLP